MDDKEKLIELLKEAQQICRGISQCEDCIADKFGETCFQFMTADHLIANNVVIQKQGEWVSKSHDDGYGEFTLWHCSQCDVPSANKRNFCHNCGAKMEGT